MAVNPSTSNTHVEAAFGSLLEPALRKIYFETWNEIPEQYSKIFNVESSSKAKETDHSLGAFGDWNQRTGSSGAAEVASVTYGTLSDGHDVVYTHAAYTKGFMISRELYDDDQYRVIQKFPKAMARSGRAFVEKKAATVLQNAFYTNIFIEGSGSTANAKLCQTHALLDSSTVTCSNKITTKLSDEGLKTALTAMRKQVDEAGNLIGARPKLLVVPPALEYKAKELLHSTQTIDSANNNVNSVKGSLELFVYDYLGGATVNSQSTDNFWFVIDPTICELNFFWRVKPEFKWDEDFDTLVAKYRGYMRFSCGASGWRGIVGSDGTTDPTVESTPVRITNASTNPVQTTGTVTVANTTTNPVPTQTVTPTTTE